MNCGNSHSVVTGLGSRRYRKSPLIRRSHHSAFGILMSGFLTPSLGSLPSSSSVYLSMFPCVPRHCSLDSSRHGKSDRATTKKKNYIGIYKTFSFQVSFVLSAFEIHGRSCERDGRSNLFCHRCGKSLLKHGSGIFALNEVNVLLTTEDQENVDSPLRIMGDNGFLGVNGGLHIRGELNVHHHVDEKIGWFSPQDDVKTVKMIKENYTLPDGREVMALHGPDRKGDLKQNNVVAERNSYEVSAENMENPNYVEVTGTEVPEEKKDNNTSLDVTKSDGRLRSKQWLERVVDKTAAGGRLKMFDHFGDLSSLYDLNGLLNDLVKARKLDAAVSLFSELLSSDGFSPSSWTLSTMIVCFCKKNEPDKARTMLDLMVESGYSPKVTTYTILINCFSRSGRLQKAFEIFDIMGRTKCNPSVQTYNCLISGLCYVGRVEEAHELLAKMKRSSIKPDIYTFTAAMDGLCKVGRSDEGMELLEEALKMGLKPNAITYNTLFDGFSREGRPLKGINLLGVMEQANCQPDFITYSTLLCGLLKWRQISAGLQIYKKMTQAGFLPDGQTMNNLLKGICQKSSTDEQVLSDSLELFEKLQQVGCCPSPYTCHVMIRTLAIRGQTGKALDLLYEMFRLNYPVAAIPLNCLMQALCNEGRVSEAWRVLMLMTRGRRLLGRKIYKRLYDEFNRQGRWLDAHKALGFALKRGINLYSN